MNPRPIILVLFVLLQSWHVTPAADGLTARSFLPRYRESLARLQSFYGQTRAEGIMTELFSRRGETKPVRDRSYSVKYATTADRVKLGLILLREEGEEQDEYREVVYVVDPPKMFSVRRQSEHDSYALHYVGDKTGNSGEFVDTIVKGYFFSPLSMYGTTISEIIDSPGFAVTKLSTPTQDQHLVRVDFEFKPSPPPARIVGYWLLDSSRGWVLREFEFSRADQPPTGRMVTSGSIEYTGDIEGLPAPKTVTIRRKFPKFQEEHSFKFENFEHEATPANEFTLDSFGLGDLANPAGSRSNRAAYTFFGLALVTFVIGVLYRRWSNRGGRSTAPSGSS